MNMQIISTTRKKKEKTKNKFISTRSISPFILMRKYIDNKRQFTRQPFILLYVKPCKDNLLLLILFNEFL